MATSTTHTASSHFIVSTAELSLTLALSLVGCFLVGGPEMQRYNCHGRASLLYIPASHVGGRPGQNPNQLMFTSIYGVKESVYKSCMAYRDREILDIEQ